MYMNVSSMTGYRTTYNISTMLLATTTIAARRSKCSCTVKYRVAPALGVVPGTFFRPQFILLEFISFHRTFTYKSQMAHSRYLPVSPYNMAEEAQWSSCTHVIDGMATLPASGMPDTDLDHGQLATSPTSNLPNADVDHGQTATSPTTGLPDMDIDCGPLTMRPSLTERSNALLDEIHHHRNNDFEHSGASASNSLLGADSQSDHSDGEGSSIDGDLECAPDSPLGYARYYGLCQDYKEGHVLDSMLIPLPPQLDAQPDETSVDEEIGSFLDNSKAHVGETHQMERENFDVDEETATFLRSVTALGKQVPSSWHGQETGLGKLKLDLPVLSGDHEVFMLKIRRRNAVRLSSNGITTFVLDDEADEGPHFSSHRSSEKDTLEKEIMSEKLDVDEETIEYLRDVHKLLTSKTQDVAGDAYKQLKVNSMWSLSNCILTYIKRTVLRFTSHHLSCQSHLRTVQACLPRRQCRLT